MLSLTVAGNLGKDAELRNAGGSPVLGFSIAGQVGFGDRQQTVWVNCSLWGKRGESLAQHLKKGTAVTAVGEMSTREHDGKTYIELRVNDLKLQGGRQEQAAYAPQQPAMQHQQSATPPPGYRAPDPSDDRLPF